MVHHHSNCVGWKSNIENKFPKHWLKFIQFKMDHVTYCCYSCHNVMDFDLNEAKKCRKCQGSVSKLRSVSIFNFINFFPCLYLFIRHLCSLQFFFHYSRKSSCTITFYQSTTPHKQRINNFKVLMFFFSSQTFFSFCENESV